MCHVANPPSYPSTTFSSIFKENDHNNIETDIQEVPWNVDRTPIALNDAVSRKPSVVYNGGYSGNSASCSFTTKISVYN